MGDFGIDLWRRIKNVFGIGDTDAQQDELDDKEIFEKKNEDGILNKTKNFFTSKVLDDKWFPYECQKLSRELKECYVLNLGEFKDVVSKSLRKRLKNLMESGNKELNEAYNQWKEAFEKCRVEVNEEGKLVSPAKNGTFVVSLRMATKNYWDAARDILSKPIMNKSYVNQLIKKVQNFTPAEEILKLHNIEVVEQNVDPNSDKDNKARSIRNKKK